MSEMLERDRLMEQARRDREAFNALTIEQQERVMSDIAALRQASAALWDSGHYDAEKL